MKVEERNLSAKYFVNAKLGRASKLTEKDADKISKEINQNIAKKFKVIN